MLGIPEDPNNHDHNHPELQGELRDKLAEGAEDDVRGQLLVEAVAEQEKIEVSDDEINARLAKMANAAEGPQLARVRAEMEKDGRLENLRFQLRQDKTLDLLVERATVVEKEPEPPADESASDS
jgi:trigger factor